jgi:hypothetical protein
MDVLCRDCGDIVLNLFGVIFIIIDTDKSRDGLFNKCVNVARQCPINVCTMRARLCCDNDLVDAFFFEDFVCLDAFFFFIFFAVFLPFFFVAIAIS